MGKRIKKTLPGSKQREVLDKFLARYKKLHVELNKMEAIRSVIKYKYGREVEVLTKLGVKYPTLNQKSLDETVIEILSEIFSELKEVYSGKTEKRKAAVERLKVELNNLKRLADVTKSTSG
jgi:hypothetical protein